ncbi:hypothetical protein GCM10023310_69330 [Paenibacillus vulneris]|uniref:Uncharacterized protein n=1 Tax=Paenibacillus vulneris TaxID=1133364 RepID=A0ABW3UH40_9BACL
MNLVQILQKKVNKITKETYKSDECSPIFTVSLLYEKAEHNKEDKDHKIILTVQHLGSAFSKVIFPQTKNVYGYESLEEEMKYLYNRTM